MEHKYLLCHHARVLLKVGPGFIELVDDDVATDKDRHRQDSYIESDSEKEVDLDLGDKGLGPDVDNGMEALPGSFSNTLLMHLFLLQALRTVLHFKCGMGEFPFLS